MPFRFLLVLAFAALLWPSVHAQSSRPDSLPPVPLFVTVQAGQGSFDPLVNTGARQGGSNRIERMFVEASQLTPGWYGSVGLRVGLKKHWAFVQEIGAFQSTNKVYFYYETFSAFNSAYNQGISVVEIQSTFLQSFTGIEVAGGNWLRIGGQLGLQGFASIGESLDGILFRQNQNGVEVEDWEPYPAIVRDILHRDGFIGVAASIFAGVIQGPHEFRLQARPGISRLSATKGVTNGVWFPRTVLLSAGYSYRFH